MSLSYNITEKKRTPISFNGANQLGYGGKIRTQYMIRVYYEKIWRRVYCTCWANSGSCWIMYKGTKVNVNDSDLMGIK